MIYNLSIFGTNIFVMIVNYDVIGIQAKGSLEKCDRMVVKVVSPTDHFETIKNGITLVARLLQYFSLSIMLKRAFLVSSKYLDCWYDSKYSVNQKNDAAYMHHYGCCHYNTFSAGKYTFKVLNRNTRNTFEKSSKLTIKRPKRDQ